MIPEALILPGVFPDLGVIVEVSAFGGQMLWFDNGAPYISPSLGELKQIDTLKTPKPGKAGLTPVVLTQLFPYINAAFSTFPEAIKIYHNEGFHSDEHIETVLGFGADIWHFGSDVHDLSDLYSRVGDKVVLFGGVDPHGVMRHGTPEEVRVESYDG